MTNTFTWNPDKGAKCKHESTRRVVRFGDGYEQRQDASINADLPTWDGITFSGRSLAESSAISAFLSAQGSAAFNWTPPRGTQALYTCDSWTEEQQDYSVVITATFRRVLG